MIGINEKWRIFAGKYHLFSLYMIMFIQFVTFLQYILFSFMKKIFFIGLLLLPATLKIAAQTENMDSLVNVLNNEKRPNEEQLSLFYKLCESKMSKEDKNTNLINARKGLSFAEKAGNKAMISKFYYLLGEVYQMQSLSNDTAVVYFNKAIDAAIEAKDKKQEALMNSLIGSVYAYQSKHTLAIEYFMKALTIAESINDSVQCTNALANIAGIHSLLGNYDQTLSYAERALTIANKINMPKAKLHPLYQIATAYSAQGKIDKALECGKELVNLSRSIDNKVFELAGFEAMTTTYYQDIKDYDNALEYSDSCMLLTKAIGNPEFLAGTLRVRSNILRLRKNFKECEATALECLAIDSTDLDYAPDLNFNIAFSNACMGNTDKAEKYLHIYKTLTDKKWNQGYKDAVASQEVKYETQKKEIRISSLERQKILYIIIGIIAILLAIGVGLVSWQKIRREQLKRQLVATSAVLEWEEKERKRFASELHDGINGMLSALKIELDAAKQPVQIFSNKLDECIETVRRMANGLMPPSLERFGMRAALEDYCRQFPNVRFHFFGEDKRIDKRIELVIYYCACELVNNSVKYSRAKNINLQLVQSEKYVSLTVQDDGCGFDKETVSQGSGLKNISNRVASCNGKLDISSLPGAGTETIIELRVKS